MACVGAKMQNIISSQLALRNVVPVPVLIDFNVHKLVTQMHIKVKICAFRFLVAYIFAVDVFFAQAPTDEGLG